MALVTLSEKARVSTSGFYSYYKEAADLGIPWHTTDNINSQASLETIGGYEPDMIFVLGWSQLLGPEVMSIARRGTVGVHTSLLPRYRGRSPLNWAIINNETEAGVTMFYLSRQADTGQVIAQQSFSITEQDDIATLYDKAELALGDMTRDFLTASPIPKGQPQDDRLATYYPKRRMSDGLLSWGCSSAAVLRKIRALAEPYPGAFFYLAQRKITVVQASIDPAPACDAAEPGSVAEGGNCLKVRTRDGGISIRRVRPAGYPAMDAATFCRIFGVSHPRLLHRPSDFPPILEYDFLDGEGGTRAYPTNIITNSTQAVRVRLANHGQPRDLLFTLTIDSVAAFRTTANLPGGEERTLDFNFAVASSGRHSLVLSCEERGRLLRNDALDIVAYS